MSLRSTMLESLATLRRPKIGRDSADGTAQDPFTVIYGTGSGNPQLPCSSQQNGVSELDLYNQRNTATSSVLSFVPN